MGLTFHVRMLNSLILPVYLANGIGMLMAAQRQLWGMARAGLVFPSLAVTNTNKDRMPWRAAIYLTVSVCIGLT